MTNRVGFSQFDRRWLDYELFQPEKYTQREAWIYLNVMRYWSNSTYDYHGKTVTIKKGQTPTSYRRLEKAWGWSQGNIARFLKMLESEGMIKIFKPAGFIVIEPLDDNTIYEQEDLLETVEGMRTPEEVKAVKVEKANIENDFNEFWIEYKPVENDKGQKNKGSKHNGLKAYKKAIKQGAVHQDIMRGLSLYMNQCHKTGHYTKHASTWLNQLGWQEDFEENNKDSNGISYSPEQLEILRKQYGVS